MARVKTFLERVLKEAVAINPGYGYDLGWDQAYVCYPCRFPTVNFSIRPHPILCQLVDSMRIEQGFTPLMDGTPKQNGWYEFWIGVNDYTDSKIDTCITAVIVGSSFDDNENFYTIDLSEDEQKIIYELLNSQCRTYFGKSCASLLAEARRRM